MDELVHIDVEGGENIWDVKMDGNQRKILERSLSEIEDEERAKIFSTAAKILSKCSDPNSTEGNSIGLGLGKVQSGKTSAFTALTALAIDNGYRIVIILAGNKKNLLNQSTKRLKRQLGNSNNEVAFLTTSDRIQSIKGDYISRLIEVGKSVIITVLKHQDHIDHLSEVFSSPDLRGLPTLIIDDEGDQASLNTARRRNTMSTVYRSINNLRSCFSNHSYVAFTATPQANLLISTLDMLHPKFCVLIEPGKGYTGGSTFHGVNEGLYNISIPDDEVGFDEGGEQGIPESLENALATFFVGATVRTLRGDHEKHSMLIHTSRLRGNHQNVDEKVRLWLERWNQVIKLDIHDPARGNFNNVIRAGYNELSRTVENMPTWEIILENIDKELIDYQVWKVNSDKDAEVLMDQDMMFKNNIFIGGSMLERGVTLPGLAVTYITRTANVQHADTVEQRARWFGYKRNYLDTCRIWATVQIRQDFIDLLGHEDELWESLKLLETENIPLDDWTVVLKLSPRFKPTRPNVATVKNFNINKWFINRRPVSDETVAMENINTCKKFFSENQAETIMFGRIEHKIVRDCSPSYVVERLIKKVLCWEGTDWNLSLILDLFNKLERTGLFNGIDVVWIGVNEDRERTFIDGVVGRLFQGRSQNRLPDDPLYYPGDENIHGNRPQLQVHFISPTQRSTGISKNIKVVLFALYIPEELANAVGRLVTPNA